MSVDTTADEPEQSKSRPVRAVRKPAGEPEPQAPQRAEAERGSVTPAQFEGDGWGDTPMQMRS